MTGRTCEYCHREGAELNSDQPDLCKEFWKKVAKNEIKLREDCNGRSHIDHKAENKCDRCHRERTSEQLHNIIYYEWQQNAYLCEACIDMQERLLAGSEYFGGSGNFTDTKFIEHNYNQPITDNDWHIVDYNFGGQFPITSSLAEHFSSGDYKSHPCKCWKILSQFETTIKSGLIVE
jgi:hypothetical protein